MLSWFQGGFSNSTSSFWSTLCFDLLSPPINTTIKSPASVHHHLPPDSYDHSPGFDRFPPAVIVENDLGRPIPPRRVMVARFPSDKEPSHIFHLLATRWAPTIVTSYKWSYNLYKWPWKNPTSGVISPSHYNWKVWVNMASSSPPT